MNLAEKKKFVSINNKKLYPILDFPGYYITTDGKVWSSPKFNKTGWRQLTLEKVRSGHLRVKVYKNGKRERRSVHRLVLETFIGPCPEGMEACHNDGVASNNRLSNLRWDTHASNVRDAINHGVLQYPVGEKSKNHKLTEGEIREIKRLLKTNEKQYVIAEKYSVNKQTITNIKQGNNWAHVDC